MNPRLFGCSTTILDNVLVVGTPSLGKKGCIHTVSYTHLTLPTNREV